MSPRDFDLRHAIIAESGINDGLAGPIVMRIPENLFTGWFGPVSTAMFYALEAQN